MRGEVFAITFVDSQQLMQEATILKQAMAILIDQFTTSGNSINPYSNRMTFREKGINFMPTKMSIIEPSVESIHMPEVMDHLIFAEVIPRDL